MNKLKLLAGSALLIIAVFVVYTNLASAHSFRSGSNVTVGQNEQVNETLFAAGQNVNINSEVFGDIFCAGQTISISGTVHGDIICAGQTVNITGNVDGDIRLAGQTVTVESTVLGNATIVGQTFNLGAKGKIAGDVTVGSTDASLSGLVGRDIAAGSENLTISSTVNRNLKASVNNLTLTSTADVKGNINYTSNNELAMANGAVVGGEITRTTPAKSGASKHGAVFGFAVGWFIYWFLAMLLTAMVIALLFPRMLQAVTNKAMPRPWKALLVGFLANLTAPFIVVILAITVIGIPLALMLMLLWFVTLLLSGPLFGYYIGRRVLSNNQHPLLIMLAGATILLVLYFIPIVGFIAFLSALWIGSGMVILEVFNRTPKPVYDSVETTAKPKLQKLSSPSPRKRK